MTQLVLASTSPARLTLLRNAGIDLPILAWLHSPRETFVAAISAGIELGIANREQLDRVAEAAKQAQSGDIVLLSPACASFDQFSDYVARAEAFVAEVQELGMQFEGVHA